MNLSKYFATLINIIFFKGKVKDIPYSAKLLNAVIIVDVLYVLVLQGLTIALLDTPDDMPDLWSIMLVIYLYHLAVVLLQIGAILYFLKFKWKNTARFNQAASAYLGVDIIFALLSYIAMLFLGVAVDPSVIPGAASYFLLGLNLWLYVVKNNIIKEMLEVSYGKGLLLQGLITLPIIGLSIVMTTYI